MLHLGSQTHTTVDLGASVELSEADRDHGIYILGKSGTGKSTLMEHCMQQDAEQGFGFCLIEPHRAPVPAPHRVQFQGLALCRR